MAIKKLTKKGYGQIELNQVAWRRDGRIEAQCRLANKDDIAENGMQEEYDRITGHISGWNVANYIMCTGNHDIRLRDFEQSKSRFLNFMNGLNSEENAKDNVYFKYEVNGYTFLSIASDKMEFAYIPYRSPKM